MSAAYTPEEARKQFMDCVRKASRYWAGLPDKTPQERCDGVAFSILSLLDGAAGMPAFDVALSPHPDDKAFHQENGENWYEPGMVINSDAVLHEEFYSSSQKI